MKRSEPYSEHLEVLLALITYMGLTGWRSRAPHGLSRDLGLDEAKVAAALARFPGLFRKGDLYETEAGLQHSYTLHAQYALRRPRPHRVAKQATRGFDGRPPSPSDPTPAQDGRGGVRRRHPSGTAGLRHSGSASRARDASSTLVAGLGAPRCRRRRNRQRGRGSHTGSLLAVICSLRVGPQRWSTAWCSCST